MSSLQPESANRPLPAARFLHGAIHLRSGARLPRHSEAGSARHHAAARERLGSRHHHRAHAFPSSSVQSRRRMPRCLLAKIHAAADWQVDRRSVVRFPRKRQNRNGCNQPPNQHLRSRCVVSPLPPPNAGTNSRRCVSWRLIPRAGGERILTNPANPDHAALLFAGEAGLPRLRGARVRIFWDARAVGSDGFSAFIRRGSCAVRAVYSALPHCDGRDE